MGIFEESQLIFKISLVIALINAPLLLSTHYEQEQRWEMAMQET